MYYLADQVLNIVDNPNLQKRIGDILHFKEYPGEIFRIDYFSHNEEVTGRQTYYNSINQPSRLSNFQKNALVKGHRNDLRRRKD